MIKGQHPQGVDLRDDERRHSILTLPPLACSGDLISVIMKSAIRSESGSLENCFHSSMSNGFRFFFRIRLLLVLCRKANELTKFNRGDIAQEAPCSEGIFAGPTSISARNSM